MSKRVRVPIYGSPGRFVEIDSEATKGAALDAGEITYNGVALSAQDLITALGEALAARSIGGVKAKDLIGGAGSLDPGGGMGSTNLGNFSQDDLQDGSTRFAAAYDPSTQATIQANAQTGKDLNTPGSGKIANTDSTDTTTGLNTWNGNTPPIVLGLTLAYTVNGAGTSLTISWSAFTIYLADGSTISVATGNQAWTVTSGTTYWIYPYYDPATSTVNFAGIVAGHPPTSQSTTAIATMSLANHIALYQNGWSVTATPGASGGGVKGGCLHSEQPLFVRDSSGHKFIVASEIEAGDSVLTPSGWQQVRSVEKQPCEEWVRVTAAHRQVIVTESQPFYGPKMQVIHAAELRAGRKVMTETGPVLVTGVQKFSEKTEKVIIAIDDPHLFYPVRGSFLIHNGVNKP